MSRRRASRTAAALAVAGLAALTATPAGAAVVPSAANGAVAWQNSNPDDGDGQQEGAPSCDVETPQLVSDVPTAIEDLGFERAWSITRGGGVKVAVVDSGIAQTNAHFPAGVVTAGANIVRADDPATVDVDGQGTAVAGIIGARGLEGSGVFGAAPESTLVPIRVGYGEAGGNDREKLQVTPGRLADGIRAAADEGARVIVVPMAIAQDSGAVRSAVEAVTDEGALVVASVGGARDAERQAGWDEEAGAESPAPGAPWYPAAYPQVLAVAAATDSGGAVLGGRGGSWVDVAAPGQNVPTAFLDALDCVVGADPDPAFATGYVGAAAALVVAAFPDGSPAEWAYRLKATASGAVTDTFSEASGWGIVNPFEALTLYVDGSAPGPTPPPSIGDRQNPPSMPAAEVDLSRPVDPEAAARDRLLWWVLGGLTAVGLLLLLPRLPRITRRRQRP